MGNHVLTTDNGHFEETVMASTIPVAVCFQSDDCQPCVTFAPAFERMAEAYSGKMLFVRADRQSEPALALRFGIKSSPTLLFFRNGEEACARLSGYVEFSDLLASVEAILGKTCPDNAKHRSSCDVLILGAGPAGLTAALYAARSKLYTVVLETSMPGGQVATTFQIANYPGANGNIRGSELMDNMKNQALSFGAEIHDMQKIVAIGPDGHEKFVETETALYKAKTLIIATGAEPRKLPIPQEKEYRGRGIHYCATCDGAMYQGTDVLVVGGGLSALEEAEFLTRYARSVTIVNRSDAFRAPKGIVDHVLGIPGVSVRYQSRVESVYGDVFVAGAILVDLPSGKKEEVQTEGLFVYIGSQPATSRYGPSLQLSEGGFIMAGEDMKTSIPGVFTAGDIREKPIRQITTAVSDGTVAAVMAERYITANAI